MFSQLVACRFRNDAKPAEKILFQARRLLFFISAGSRLLHVRYSSETGRTVRFLNFKCSKNQRWSRAFSHLLQQIKRCIVPHFMKASRLVALNQKKKPVKTEDQNWKKTTVYISTISRAMEDTRLSRAVAEYQPMNQRFLIPSKNYAQQYSHLYTVRLAQMRKNLRYIWMTICCSGHLQWRCAKLCFIVVCLLVGPLLLACRQLAIRDIIIIACHHFKYEE